MAQKTIIHDRLGKITLSQTRRSRRLSLTVRAPGVVRLSFPESVPLKEALRFAESKEDWVKRAVAKYEKHCVQIVEEPYTTRSHTLKLNPIATDEIKIRIKDGAVTVSYPAELSHRDGQVQSAIKKGIEEAWRIEAKELLPKRVEYLARKFDFKYGKVTIRNTVSKWGSCSARNDLSLSLHLMRMPDHLIDYILLHELCHTIHKNHGPKFHRLLDKLTDGQHKELRKESRNYHTRW